MSDMDHIGRVSGMSGNQEYRDGEQLDTLASRKLYGNVDAAMSVQPGEQEMIDALIGGKLVGAALERTASSGKTFVTCKVRVADGDGENQFVSVVVFDANVKIALLALGDGDSVALSGAMTVGSYEARDGTTRISIKLVASAVLTPYHVKRKREAVAQVSAPKPEPTSYASAVGKRNGVHKAQARDADSIPDDAL